MTGARTRLLESLRGSIARVESTAASLSDAHAGAGRVALGHAEAGPGSSMRQSAK